MLALGIEIRSYELHLVNGLRGITELAWRTKSFRVGGSPKPKLIESSESKVQPYFVTGAVFTEIERHAESVSAANSEV